MFTDRAALLQQLRRPRVFVPVLLVLMSVGGAVSYLILLNPGSPLMRLFRGEPPQQFGMITLGPYPQEEDFPRLQAGGIRYIVSLLDPSLPYEKPMLEREVALAEKYGIAVKNFPLFPVDSMFDTEIAPQSVEEEKKAVAFLQNVDGRAYVHCYLGRHRALRVREKLLKAGVPENYFEAGELDNRITEAWNAFRNRDYVRVLVILEPVRIKDGDVAYLRGWAYYRLRQNTEAAKSFREGLELDPTNPRNLLGLGYCYLQSGQPVMALRQFDAVLEQIPNESSALVGQGLAYLQLGNKKAAADKFRTVLAKRPDNEEVKGYLKQAESP